MKDKKIIISILSFLLVLIIIVGFFVPKKIVSVSAMQNESSAKSMCVIEQTSKRVLMEKDKDERLPMASTTKIMTALVALENCDNLDEEFATDNRAVGIEGTSIYLKNDEKLSMRELLYGLMLNSGNDAAMAIAYRIGQGKVEKFVDLMNAKAKELELENTHFDNPHGLDSETHYTSSYDLAIITAKAMENKGFREIVKTDIKEISAPKEMGHRFVRNKHKLLKSMVGCEGVKTGFTDNARRCCVTSCNRDGMRLICVVLNCNDMFEESQKCLEMCFDDYHMESIYEPYQYVGNTLVNDGTKERVNLYIKDGFLYPIKEEEKELIETEIKYDEVVNAPFDKDKEVGEVITTFDGKTVNKQKVYTIEEGKQKTIADKAKDIFDQWYLN